MKLFTLKRFFVVTLLMCLGIGQSWGWSKTYTVKAIATEGGAVNVSNTTTPGTFSNESSINNTLSARYNSTYASATHYFHAIANDGYYFVGWSSSATGAIETTDNPYKYDVRINGNSAAPNKTLYARFEKVPEGSFTNPVLNVDAADPTVLLADDGYYYMCCSESYSGEGMPLWRSADMINWEKVTTIFAQRPENVTYTYLWAPELAYVNGKYVLYYANAEYGNQENTQICVATSDHPYGPYENNKILLRAHDNNYGALNANVNNVIDPSLFRDTDSKNYLIWGSFNGIFYIQLDANCTSLATGASKKQIATTNDYNGQYDDWDDIEAPMIIKRDNYYYLIASTGNTADKSKDITYKMVMARGTSLGGNFYNADNKQCFDGRLLNSRDKMSNMLSSNDYVLGPGHCSQIVKDKNGTDWIFYHGYKKTDGNWDMNAGRVLFADKVLWGEWYTGWPGIRPPSTDPIVMPEIPDEAKVKQEENKPITHNITSAGEWQNFVTRVNGGAIFDNANITEDLDFTGITYTPMGLNGMGYKGTIDGGNHRIMNLNINTSNGRQGLIGTAWGGTTIKNIIIDSSSEIVGGQYTGGFIGRTDGVGDIHFINCGNEAHIQGGQNTAGFVGCSVGSTVYWENCYNYGNIDGNNESAAFSGWRGAKLVNCWNSGRTMGCQGAGDGKWYSLVRSDNDVVYTNTYDVNSDNASNVGMPENYSTEWLADGHLAYFMNDKNNTDVWTQDLLADNSHPTFGAPAVALGKWDGINDVYYNDLGDKAAAANVVITEENSELNIPHNKAIVKNINIKRTLKAKKWNTLSLPFDWNASMLLTDNDTKVTVEVEELKGLTVKDNNYAMKFEYVDNPEAATPYLVRVSEEVTKIKAKDVELSLDEQPVATATGENYETISFVGNYSKIDKVNAGDYVIQDNTFRLVTDASEVYLNGFRGYFTIDGTEGAHSLSFEADGDESTGITSVMNGNDDGNYYNVAGQRVNASTKGIIIKNGRKFINK